MLVEYVYTSTKGKVLSVLVQDGGRRVELPLREVLSRGLKFKNAIVVSDYIRGKGCKLPRKVAPILSNYRNSKVYDGVSPKMGVTINGKDYIAKTSKSPYDTSIFSEYVASRFIRNLGFSAHNVELYLDGTDTLYLLAEDFTQSGGKLVCFKDTNQSSEDTNLVGKEYTYDDVLYLISQHTKIKKEFKKNCINYFWDMFMLDGILGNRDRHHGNWGYLAKSNGYMMAPLFDNGASLFPDISRVFYKYKEDRVSLILERCEKFPASLLCERVNGIAKRTNFYYFINDENLSKYPDMRNSLARFRNLGLGKIYSAICSACDNYLIPDDLKEFYISIVCSRYLHIIGRVPLSDIGGMITETPDWGYTLEDYISERLLAKKGK